MNSVAVDTSVLLRVVLDESADGDRLRAFFARRAVRGTRFLVPACCLAEFWPIATNIRAPVRIAPSKALVWLDRLLTSGADLLVPGPAHWQWLGAALAADLPVGIGFSHCQIAALCREFDVRELWTFDRSFSAFDGIDAVDPLSAAGEPGAA